MNDGMFETRDWKLAQFLCVALGYDLENREPTTRGISDIYKQRILVFQFPEYRECDQLTKRYIEAGNIVQNIIKRKPNPTQ